MLRIICCENEHTAAIHVGGPPEITHKTFDVEAPEVEQWLDRYKGEKGHQYNVRVIVGVERIGKGDSNGQQES